jgi:serine protease Do
MKRNPVAWAALIVASAALVSSSGFLRPMPAAPRAPLEGQQAAKSLSEAYEAVAEFVRPSVVQITVQKKAGNVGQVPGLPNMRRFQFPPRGNENMPRDFEDMLRKFLNPEGNPEKEQFGFRNMGVGSGFVYDNLGHILTNNHVVENAEKIRVTFHDGVEVDAKVVGADKQTDVAVIKVDDTSHQALPKGDSGKLKVGELVMAVGSPFELSQSVTTGIISALERNAVGINEYESFIQTDAPINRGRPAV